MKKIFLVVISLFCMVFCHGQIKTSFEDYNYVTNPDGLKRDINASRGIKDGYNLEPILQNLKISWNDGRFKSASIFYFKKASEKKAIVVYAIDEKGNSNYLCIPGTSSDKSVWDMCNEHIESLGSEWMLIFSIISMKTISLKLL